MTIVKKTGTINTTSLKGRKIEWIVIHYTAGTTSKAGSALNLAAYYLSGKAAASSDFIVDDTAVVQYNGDIANRYTWGVGSSKYTSMSTPEGGRYYHEGLVDADVWLAVQDKFSHHHIPLRKGKVLRSWMSGLLMCPLFLSKKQCRNFCS